MGYIKHDTVIVVVSDYVYSNPGWMPDVEAFKESLPEGWRHLIVGPVSGLTNGYDTYVFLPDGSKEGWDTSDEGDAHRSAFIDLFQVGYSDKSSPFDITIVRHGGDDENENTARHIYPARTFNGA